MTREQLPLKDQLNALEHVQEIDLKIDNLQRNRAAVPAALKSLEDALARAKAAVAAKQNAIAELEKLQRQTKAAVELNNDRLSRANAKLEGVGNSQEYQAASKEIEQLRKLAISLEEQTKKAVTEIGTAGNDLTGLNAAVEKAQAERDAQAEKLSGETGKLDSEIAALQKEREQFTGKVDPRMLTQYNRIRAGRAGVGIVPAIGGRCKGCNMMIPPQMYNEVQRGTGIQQCPSCFRLLYAPSSGAPEASAGA